MARQRLDRRRRALSPGRRAAVFALALALGCTPPGPPPGDAVPLDTIVAGLQLAGAWEWRHVEIEDGTLRREEERWQFVATADPRRLIGRNRREVTVRALDDVPFLCNQAPSYQQRAEIIVAADIVRTGIALTELGYTVEPGPCDPGLRQLGAYVATVRRDELHLAWPGGEATLRRTDTPPRPPRPPRPPPPAGPWTWEARSWTRAGRWQHEREDWELAVSRDGRLAGSYLRTVTVGSPDGAAVPCAGAARYRVVDRYLVRGVATDDGWRLEEHEVEAGHHPCLAATPGRTLDGATASADGEHLVLSWRGKRRQVLARPAPP